VMQILAKNNNKLFYVDKLWAKSNTDKFGRTRTIK
jgi:hypothetical protein